MAVSCGGGHRRSSDSMLLWLWHWLAAVVPIRPLAWEPPYAADAALEKRQKDQKKKKKYIKRNYKSNIKALWLFTIGTTAQHTNINTFKLKPLYCSWQPRRKICFNTIFSHSYFHSRLVASATKIHFH